MVREIKTTMSTTFAEYRLLPGLTKKEHSPENISLETPLVKYEKSKGPGIKLNVPFVSAVMQAVSGPEMAISLAREGGIGFIFCSQPVENQARMIKEVKRFKAGFVRSDSNLKPGARIKDVIELTEATGHSTIAITKTGKNDSELLGLVTDMDYWPTDDPETPVEEIMTPVEDLTLGYDGITLKEANSLLRKSKKSCIPIVSDEKERKLRYLVFKKDYMMHRENPLELLDESKRLLVGAGINTRDYEERVPALVEKGVDVLVIDTSDGYTEYVEETLKWVKRNYPELPVGAGNVVNKEGFKFLVEAGADFVKVGIGGGSICITQEQKGIGRGQAAALREIVEERDSYMEKSGEYVPICSDGGLVQDSHILMALAFGADFVMMGRYFARFKESPTNVKDIGGKLVKPYWGEGSERARNWQRYYTGGGSSLKFEEGVEGNVPYVGSLKENIGKTLAVIKSTMGNVGVSSIEELHSEAVVERTSEASMYEGKAHDVMLPKEKEGGRDKVAWE